MCKCMFIMSHKISIGHSLEVKWTYNETDSESIQEKTRLEWKSNCSKLQIHVFLCCKSLFLPRNIPVHNVYTKFY